LGHAWYYSHIPGCILGISRVCDFSLHFEILVGAKQMNVHKFFAVLKDEGKIFGATTLRKRNKKFDGEIVALAGEEIKSVYRLGVSALKKDAVERQVTGDRAYSDAANGVLTVYDVCKRDKDGVRGAFRRIDLEGVVEIRAFKESYVPQWNDVDNDWDIVLKA
jgi:hypothetical protein